MAASIDVVVPVHNRYELTAECLRGLRRQRAGHRVIVVDDASGDATPQLLRDSWPEVTVVELERNVGFTRAVNAGVRAGNGEIVVLVNNDVQLHEDFLEHVTAPLAADAAVGSVAALLLAPGEGAIDSFGVTADPTLAGFARLQGHPPSRARRAPRPVLTGPEATAGAYRRDAWEQAGGFDEHIRAYMEVLDLAMRMRTAGWQTAEAPDAVGVHLGSQTYGRRSGAQRRLAGFSRGYLLRRYGVLRRRVAARTLLTEALVVAADALTARDLSAARGRLQGWRAARGSPRRPWPPAQAIDSALSLRASLALRRGALRPAAGGR